MKHSSKIAAALSELEILDRYQLAIRWEKTVKHSVPKSASRIFLLRALAYELQSKRSLGLTKAEEATLAESVSPKAKEKVKGSPAKNAGPKTSKSRPQVALVPGSRLVREWQGRTYTVSVIEEGFIYQNKTWSSLSAIATDITGSRWSGPKFFGLHGTPSSMASPTASMAAS